MMKRLIISAMALMATLSVFAQTKTKVTVEVEEMPPPPTAVRKVALVVQNHAAPGENIPFMALTDALTAKLSGCGLQVINPYNSVGVNQNRNALGEKTPEVSAMELARQLKADGAITASITDVFDSPIGIPPILHQYSIYITLNLADAWTGATVIQGETVTNTSCKYTNNQVAQNKRKILHDLMYSTADECAARLKQNPNLLRWTPTPPPPPPPPPTPPWLTLPNIEEIVQSLYAKMRMNQGFREHYATIQAKRGGKPTVVFYGILDLTGGKSATKNVPDLLDVVSQDFCSMLRNSALFEVKDDKVSPILRERILKSGNSSLEDKELLSVAETHHSPDFMVVGDLRWFPEEGKRGTYRFFLGIHDFHTGTIAWSDNVKK